MHGEDADIQPRAAYATSKRYGEEALLELADKGLCPVILRNGTVYGWSPRMRFDLVVNTFVKDALLSGSLKLHGGGWMWRPLVDIRDCADAMIAGYEAPAEKVRGEIFNVVHSNYQIRELAMIVAGSVQLTGRGATLEEVPSLQLTRNYECANAKLSTTLGFIPRRSVLEAVSDLLSRIDRDNRVYLTDPRAYNIRWLELLHEVKPVVDSFALFYEGADHRWRGPARFRSGRCSATRHAHSATPSSTSPMRDALDRASTRWRPTWCSTAPRFTTSTSVRSSATRRGEVNVEAVRELALRSPRLVHVSTNYVFDGAGRSRTARRTFRRPRSVYALTKLAGEHAALAYAPRALVVRTGGLYGFHGSASKGGNFVQRMVARAREQGALRMVADQRLQPTFTADLAAAVAGGGPGRRRRHRPSDVVGRVLLARVHAGIMERAGIDVAVEPVETTIATRWRRPPAQRGARASSC